MCIRDRVGTFTKVDAGLRFETTVALPSTLLTGLRSIMPQTHVLGIPLRCWVLNSLDNFRGTVRYVLLIKSPLQRGDVTWESTKALLANCET